MYLNQLLEEKGISKYKLAKLSGVPQSTIADICSGKTNIKKCSAETLYKISKALDVTMESLIEYELNHKRIDFELFKSNVCHSVKSKGDIEFLIETLQSGEIREYYNLKWYAEAFYLLAMVDYLSRINNIDICTNYNDIRCQKLKKTIYPRSVLLSDRVFKLDIYKKEAIKKAIPEFLHFNIVESEIKNVC